MNERVLEMKGPSERELSLAVRLMLGVVSIYRLLLSPILGGQCRFHPSCSVYAEQALRMHGAIKGAKLALLRVLRCNPLHPGGVDLVPEPRH